MLFFIFLGKKIQLDLKNSKKMKKNWWLAEKWNWLFGVAYARASPIECASYVTVLISDGLPSIRTLRTQCFVVFEIRVKNVANDFHTVI